MRSVLADTGPLYALVDPDDQHHLRAQGELTELTTQGATVLVAFPTLLESYTLVLRRLGLQVAQNWWDEIITGAGLVNPDREDYLAAGRRAQSFSDQTITLFDAVVAVLSERLETGVWTYDHHFDVMRVGVWRRDG